MGTEGDGASAADVGQLVRRRRVGRRAAVPAAAGRSVRPHVWRHVHDPRHALRSGLPSVRQRRRRRPVQQGAGAAEPPGAFRCSRASYLAGLLRPRIISDLQLKRHGLKYLLRDPSSFTPTLPGGPHGGKGLLLGSDAEKNRRSVAQFSERDAAALEPYEAMRGPIRASRRLQTASWGFMKANNQIFR